MWIRDDSLKAINPQWHERRAEARRNAFSANEFGPIEREKFDLDDAGITGKDNSGSYTIDRPLNGEQGPIQNGVDVRALDDR